ncbi:MAG: hypothetical protein WEA34_08955, partial [Gemmatimonadota bacterium]
AASAGAAEAAASAGDAAPESPVPSGPAKPDATPRPAASAAEAWDRWLEAGRGVPKGLTAFLRSATVEDLGDGAVSVSPLPGPAAERLADAVVQDAIRKGLEPFLGRPVTLSIGAASEAPPATARVTQSEVREDTMRALFRQEPRLKRAVEELDLELMD